MCIHIAYQYLFHSCRIIMIFNNKRRRQCYFIVWGKEIFERFIDFIFISFCDSIDSFYSPIFIMGIIWV